MRKISKFIQFTLLLALCGCSSTQTALFPQPTPLPEYEAVFADIHPFLEEENFPRRSAIYSYLKTYLPEHKDDLNQLADAFQMVNQNAKDAVHYTTDFGPFRSEESYLERNKEAVTTKSKEGRAFYNYMEKNGKLPFQYIRVYPYLSTPMIAFGMMGMDAMESRTVIENIWLVRGECTDALHLFEKPYLHEGCSFTELVNIDRIDSEWYLCWLSWPNEPNTFEENDPVRNDMDTGGVKGPDRDR